MKKLFYISIGLFIASIASAQTTTKINKVENPAKINSIEIESINKLGAVTVEAYYKNCKEILEKQPGSPDGVYTIDPDGSGPVEAFDCYCDMTTDGGGWTMIGNFINPSAYEDYFYAQSNSVYGTDIANPNSSSSWTDWRILAGVTWPAEFVMIMDRPTFATGWETQSPKVIHRVKNRNIMPNYGTSQDLVTGDNLYYKFNCSDSWNDVGSTSTSNTTLWYPRTSSNTYLFLFLEGPDYTTYYGAGVPGGDNTWYHSVRLLIR